MMWMKIDESEGQTQESLNPVLTLINEVSTKLDYITKKPFMSSMTI